MMGILMMLQQQWRTLVANEAGCHQRWAWANYSSRQAALEDVEVVDVAEYDKH